MEILEGGAFGELVPVADAEALSAVCCAHWRRRPTELGFKPAAVCFPSNRRLRATWR